MKNKYLYLLALSSFGLFILLPITSFYITHLEKQLSSIENNAKEIRRKISILKSDIKYSQDNLSKFLTYKDSDIKKYNRQISAVQQIESLKNKYAIDKLRWNFSKEEITMPKRRAKIIYPISTYNIDMEYSSMKAEDSINFIKDLEKETKGVVILKSVEIKKSKTPFNIAIKRIKKSKRTNLIKSNISLSWRSIATKENAKERSRK